VDSTQHTMSEIELSREARELREELQRQGKFPNAAIIYSSPLPPKRWWAAVSKHAATNDPFWKAVKEIMFAQAEDPTVPAWPSGLFEVEESFPAISQDEAIAILDRYLAVEKGTRSAGVGIHPLHWEVLSAQYCPLRERSAVLRELANAGYVTESAGGPIYRGTNLHWPLTITEKTVSAMKQGRLDARLPFLRRIEDSLSGVLDAYPNIIRVLFWLLLGGGAVKLIESAFGLIDR